MTDFAWPVQQAVYAKLRADAGLVALVGDGASPEQAKVYDFVPDNVAPDYVTIGDDTVADRGNKTHDGQDITLTLHAWSRPSKTGGPAGRGQVKRIQAALYAALHRQDLTVSGATVVQVRFEFGESFLDPDGRTWHGVLRFRVLLHG
jgi:hypothetical protein